MYELPVSTEEYEAQLKKWAELYPPLDPWRGGPLKEVPPPSKED